METSVKTFAASLKCSTAVNSAANAGSQASEHSKVFLGQVQSHLDDFVRLVCLGVQTLKKQIKVLRRYVPKDQLTEDLRVDALNKADVVHSQCLRQLQAAVERTQQVVGVSHKAHRYIHHASLAGADTAARGVRTSMQRARKETLSRLLRMPTDKSQWEHGVQQTALDLPFSPTSLFGGRLQVALNMGKMATQGRDVIVSQLSAAQTGHKGKVSLPDNLSGNASGKRPAAQQAGNAAKKPRFPQGGGGKQLAAPAAAGNSGNSAKSKSSSKRKDRRKKYNQKGKPKSGGQGKPQGKPKGKANRPGGGQQ